MIMTETQDKSPLLGGTVTRLERIEATQTQPGYLEVDTSAGGVVTRWRLRDKETLKIGEVTGATLRLPSFPVLIQEVKGFRAALGDKERQSFQLRCTQGQKSLTVQGYQPSMHWACPLTVTEDATLRNQVDTLNDALNCDRPKVLGPWREGARTTLEPRAVPAVSVKETGDWVIYLWQSKGTAKSQADGQVVTDSLLRAGGFVLF